jgi:uncharacterized repeat protein (TIGR03847 family)
MDVPDPFSSDFSSPDFVAVGTVGPPGARVFLFQIAQGRARVTVKVEKAQVAALAEFLRKMIKDARGAGRGQGQSAAGTSWREEDAPEEVHGGGGSMPERGVTASEGNPTGSVVAEMLENTWESPDWVAGTIALAYDESENRIVLFMESLERAGEGTRFDPSISEQSIASEIQLNEPTFGTEGLDIFEGLPKHRVRLTLSLGEADRLADLAQKLVAAGRPICPLCHGPMDPAGHRCPRSNGHGPPEAP